MERVQSLVLAIVVAAVSFFAVRQLFDSGADEHALAYGVPSAVVGADAARQRDLPHRRRGGGDGSSRDEQRPPRRGDAPGEARRPGSGGRSGGSGASGEAEMIASAARKRSEVLETARREAGLIGGGVATDEANALLALRSAAVPHGRGGRDDSQPPPVDGKFEFVDEVPSEAPGAGDVLLSLPFKNGVDPETGEPLETGGLVVNDGAVEFTEDAVLTFPAGGHVDGAAGSISFEIEPRWAGGDETNNSLVQIRDEHIWENNLQLVKNLSTLRFIIIDEAGTEHNVNIPITDWPAGERRRVTATWGDALMALYVDGEQVGQTTLSNGLKFSDTTPIHIGSDFAGASYAGAGGQISEFKVYGRALSPDEIN